MWVLSAVSPRRLRSSLRLVIAALAPTPSCGATQKRRFAFKKVVLVKRKSDGTVFYLPFERHEGTGELFATLQRGLQSFGFFLQELFSSHHHLHLGAQKTLHSLLQTRKSYLQIGHRFAETGQTFPVFIESRIFL